MKLHLLGIALLAASAASFAQTQSGSGIGSNAGGSVNTQPRPLPQPLPSTGTSADTAGTQGTSPRGPDTSVGSSSSVGGGTITDRSSGLCDTLIGDERAKCLREQASTGTAGAGSTGMGAGGTR
jgi:hypothetical protein